MNKHDYLDNAFWEDGIDDRSQVKCIRVTTLPDGKRRNDVMLFHKMLPNGTECQHYKEVVSKLGIEKIDNNTKERRERKDRDHQEKRTQHEQQKQASGTGTLVRT